MDEIVYKSYISCAIQLRFRAYLYFAHTCGRKNVSSIQQEMLAERELSILYIAAVHHSTHSALQYILVHMNV
jgi:hypothetical protein